jgi:hypothetical protein
MTGADHYARAERLLESASKTARTIDALPSLADKEQAALTIAPVVANVLAHAQAHATLALVAATRATANPWNRAFDLDPGETS